MWIRCQICESNHARNIYALLFSKRSAIVQIPGGFGFGDSDHDHLGDDYLEGKPPELATLLGRNVFLGTTTAASGATNGKLLQQTYEAVHGSGLYSRWRRD